MADRLDHDTVVQWAPDALSRRTLDGVLVFTPDMSEVLQISTPGDLIWELLAEPLAVSDLVNTLSERFDVPYETIREQIRQVLVALVEGGAVLAVPAPGVRRE